MAENSTTPPSRFEDKVILTALLTGFPGSIFIYFLDLPAVIVATFLGTGIAALIYRFLGGAAGASMAMGTLKLSGSIAVLLGSAWFINNELIGQIKDSGDPATLASVTFTPHPSAWVAIDKSSGEPVEVKVNETSDRIGKPDNGVFKNVPLRLFADKDRYVVTPEEDSLFILGQVNSSFLRSSQLFNAFDKTEDFVVTERLIPGGSDFLSPFPFRIKTTTYANEYSHFQLLSKTDDQVIYEGRIYRRRFELVKLNNRHYFIAVVEVNHQPKDPDNAMSRDPYAKFAIAEIRTVLE